MNQPNPAEGRRVPTAAELRDALNLYARQLNAHFDHGVLRVASYQGMHRNVQRKIFLRNARELAVRFQRLVRAASRHPELQHILNFEQLEAAAEQIKLRLRQALAMADATTES